MQDFDVFMMDNDNNDNGKTTSLAQQKYQISDNELQK